MTGTLKQSKVLDVNSAEIKTVSVQVKVMTLNGKQVTLSVFRQLKDEDIIDTETGALLGEPWGTVNYHPDKCGDHSKHLHVVWQKGEELRRATVWPFTVMAEDSFSYAEGLCVDYLCELALADKLDRSEGWRYIMLCGFRFCNSTLPAGLDFLSYQNDLSIQGLTGLRDWEKKRVQEYREKSDFAEKTFEQIKTEIREEVQTYKVANELFKTNFKMLQALDQLFIAI